jgi:hypothetical protein
MILCGPIYSAKTERLPSTSSTDAAAYTGSLQFQLAQLLHVGAAGAEDVADIGAAGQVTYAEPQQPALEVEILAHAAIPIALPWPFAARATI